jgi:prepilin-type N-terminal cleavage/methylation domain-containing protein
MRRKNGGFTLVELLVVLAVIALLAGAVLPSMAGLFTAGADSQAYNLIAAQLAAARALAIQEGRLAGVHVQIADGDRRPELRDACFAAVVELDQATGNYVLANGFVPQRIPSAMAFGEISSNTVSGGNYTASALGSQSFTSFTVVFNKSGGIPGTAVQFLTTGDIFDFTASSLKKYLWNPSVANPSGNPENSVSAMVMFDYDKFMKMTSLADRAAFLEAYGQVLPINHYTGALMGRERQ